MRQRITARVFLFDAQGRILLMKGRLPSDPDAPGAWFTVGGGVEAGEALEAAAAREVLEETGLTDVRIGDLVWRGEQTLRDRKGRPVLFKEHYFVARCGGGPLSREGWKALEREFVDDIRWWTQDALAGCPDRVFPDGLAMRLADLLARAPPGDRARIGES